MARGNSRKQGFFGRLKGVFTPSSDADRDLKELGRELDKNRQADEELADRRRDLKLQADKFRAAYKRKKAEYDAAVGPSKKILGREAQQILQRMKDLQKKDDIIQSTQRRFNIQIQKIEQAMSLIEANKITGTEKIEDVALILEEQIEEMMEADEQVKQLEGLDYVPSYEEVSLEDMEAELGLTEKEEPLEEIEAELGLTEKEEPIQEGPLVGETEDEDEDDIELPDLEELESRANELSEKLKAQEEADKKTQQAEEA